MPEKTPKSEDFMGAAEKEKIRQEISKIIKDFEDNRAEYNTTDEANVETKLIEPLFAALGWEKSDFEKREKVKRKERRGITDYTYRLQNKSVFVLEAKKVKVDVNSDKETWKQAVSYTFSKKVGFAVLTNFQDLILFCTEDEMAMRPFRQINYTEYLTSRFEDLLLLSKKSFEKNLIFERAASEGRMKKRRSIDEELLSDMIASRKKIAGSIEQNYNGKYTILEKDDIAQRILGRLIFIRKCEDKQINFDKNNKEIELIRTVTSLPHNEAYPALKKIFSKYNDAFDSGLFARDFDSDADKIELDGKAIKELVEHTYESSDGNYIYNFEWIGADILGNMYEQYLGHILKETAKQTRLKKSHAHRKEQGIYYTPTEIVDYIVTNTLGEVLKEKKPEEVRKLKVLDPACGSGSFLIKAFDVLEDYYEKNLVEKQKRLDSTGDYYTTKEQVLVNNIHGVDLDHKAVEIAQLNLLLKVAEKGHRLPLLQKNIQKGNSLVSGSKEDLEKYYGEKWGEKHPFDWEGAFSSIMTNGGFDVVIGNPPWVESKKFEKADKEFYADKFSVAKRQYDLFTLFIERGMQKLKEGGLLGFIIPDRFLTNLDYEPFRKFVLDNCKILQIIDLGDDVFPDVRMPSAILILQKEKDAKKRAKNVLKFAERASGELGPMGYAEKEQSSFSQNSGLTFSIFSSLEMDEVISKMNEGSIAFGDIVSNARGVEIGKGSELISSKKESNRQVKFLVGEDIDRYWMDSNKYLRLDAKGIDYKEPETYLGTKILIRKTGSGIRATIDTEDHHVIQVIYIFKTKTKDFDEKYLVGVLNSKLMGAYYSSLFGEKGRKTFPHLTQGKVLQLPIKVVGLEKQREVAKLVDTMISLNRRLLQFGDKNTLETAKLKEERYNMDISIDSLVYEIYGITEVERKIIEKSIN